MKVNQRRNQFVLVSALLLLATSFCYAAPTQRSRRKQATTYPRTYSYNNYAQQATRVTRTYQYQSPAPYQQHQQRSYAVAQATMVLPAQPQIVTRSSTPSVVSQPATTGSAIAEVNAIRARQGLPAFIEDPSLSAVAHQKATIQANRGAMFHPGGSMGGARYEGVGMGAQFTSCYLHSNIGQYAGAATVVSANGQRYHCLLIK